MKKVTKSYSGLFDKKITFTIDEKLTKLQGKIMAPKKLEEANKHLSRMKSLPTV